jgi:galactose mutarotase-like enzyme
MTGEDGLHRFGNDRLEVAVKAEGGELVSLRIRGGAELLWQAGPEWPRHAPVLFPVVGRLANDTLRHDGRTFRMTQHGFARDRRFDWLARDADGCRLLLRDDDATRAIYPFRFALEIAYRLQGDVLQVEYCLRNPGDVVLPASLGAHPAFRWPLADGIAKRAHRLVFDHDETAPIRRVENGLLRAQAEPSPIAGRILALDEGLFDEDAVILDQLASHSLIYMADETAPVLTIGWHGMTQLGIWSKPGADFLCIEPWHGLASPAGFDGPFTDKPHLLHLAPGAEVRPGWSVRVEAPGGG